jgi:membrane fusion protein (multidrug efflux system)
MFVCKCRPVEGLLLAGALWLLAGCGEGKPPAPPPLPVALQTVAVAPFPQSAELTAQVEGAREVEVRARVSGILLAQSYREGAEVKAGDPLFRIDPAPFEIALALARAQLAQEQARADQAAAESGRQQALLKDRAASVKEAADAQALAAAAAAARDIAAAKVRSAELDLSYCEVRAPIAGITGRLVRSEGSLVSPGADSLLTTVVQREPIWVRFGVSEQDFQRLFAGDAVAAGQAGVEVLDAAGQALPLTGKVNFVAAQVESRLGTIPMRAEFANPGQRLLPGQFVRVRLTGRPLPAAVTVPASCLLQSAQGRFVYVLGPGDVAQVRPVQLAFVSGARAILTGGLNPGDRVVLDNLVKVRPGAPLAPRAPAPPPAK